jgi:hypothetical protein
LGTGIAARAKLGQDLRKGATMDANPTPPSELPFAGLKVVDFCWVVAGPMTTRYLADYGATVVRVESAHRPDVLRRPVRDLDVRVLLVEPLDDGAERRCLAGRPEGEDADVPRDVLCGFLGGGGGVAGRLVVVIVAAAAGRDCRQQESEEKRQQVQAMLLHVPGPFVESVWVTDAEGRVRITSLEEVPERFDVSDREYFQKAKTVSGRVHISDLFVGEITGRASFNLVRAIQSPSERFDGVVFVRSLPASGAQRPRQGVVASGARGGTASAAAVR